MSVARKFFLKKIPTTLMHNLPASVGESAQDLSRFSAIALENRWLAGKSPATQAAYSMETAKLRQWMSERGMDPRRILALSVSDAREYASHLRATLSPASVARALNALSSYWTSAARELADVGITLPNPWASEDVPRPRVPDRVPWRILAEEEVQAMVGACRTPRELALILALYHTGCRVSELVSAKWDDIQETPSGPVLTIVGKESKSRAVGISLAALDALHKIRRRGSPWLFPGQSGRHLTRGAAWVIVHTVARRAGIKRPVSPHWLRHSNASHALHRGADLATVMQTLGHADLRMTTKYLHAQPGKTTADFLPGAERQRKVKG
jgi:integrase/recombinase XerD